MVRFIKINNVKKQQKQMFQEDDYYGNFWIKVYLEAGLSIRRRVLESSWSSTF